MGTHPIFESDFDCLTEKIMKLFNSLALASLATAEVYFKEDFSADNWEARWLQSKHKDDFGAFVLESGKWNEMKGLKTSTDAKFYASSAGFPAFTNKGKDLVVQFTVQHQQKIDCRRGYARRVRVQHHVRPGHLWLLDEEGARYLQLQGQESLDQQGHQVQG